MNLTMSLKTARRIGSFSPVVALATGVGLIFGWGWALITLGVIGLLARS